MLVPDRWKINKVFADKLVRYSQPSLGFYREWPQKKKTILVEIRGQRSGCKDNTFKLSKSAYESRASPGSRDSCRIRMQCKPYCWSCNWDNMEIKFNSSNCQLIEKKTKQKNYSNKAKHRKNVTLFYAMQIKMLHGPEDNQPKAGMRKAFLIKWPAVDVAQFGLFRHEVTFELSFWIGPSGMWQESNRVHSGMAPLLDVAINSESSALKRTNGSVPFGTWLKWQISADATGLRGHSMALDNIRPVNPIMNVKVSVAWLCCGGPMDEPRGRAARCLLQRAPDLFLLSHNDFK